MNLVIDASVLIKFFVPETLSEKAEALLESLEHGDVGLFAPDLIYPEAGNILWKKHRLKELTRSEIEEITESIISLPLNIEASKSLIPLAIDIGMAYRITVYDALYVSMARVYETIAVTADKKLFDAMIKTDLKKYISWLGSYNG